MMDSQEIAELREENNKLKRDLSSMKKAFNLANNWRNENLDNVNEYEHLKEIVEKVKQWREYLNSPSTYWSNAPDKLLVLKELDRILGTKEGIER